MSNGEFPVRDVEEGDRLHARKNAPWIDGQYKDLTFPAYHYTAYPKYLYRHTLNGPEHCLIQTAAQQAALGSEWQESPDEAQARHEAHRAVIAQAAAESAAADRHMSPTAQAERAAYDAEAEDHVVDVPAGRRRGRPAKV